MKLDRLLSRIRAALTGYSSEFEQRALADEYTAWCAKAAQRLEQVVPLIREGQDFPALQIAESAPPVLDLVRQLSFAEADQWRAFCRQRNLPAAPPFDERGVDLVNQLYSKKISETHPLYREYRQAIRTRQDEQALRVLKSIRRINHDDANAHAEFARLAHKLFARRRGELATALDRDDSTRALELMEALDADNWPGREEDPIWRRGLQFREARQLADARVRCLDLAGQLRRLHTEGHWQDALPALAEWDSLRGQFKFSLPPESDAQVAEVRQWAGGLLAGRRREQDREKLWRQVTARLDELAQEQPAQKSARVVAAQIENLAAQATILAAHAREGHAAPTELVLRLDRKIAELRRHLRQRKFTVVGLAAAATLLILAAAGFSIRARVWNVRQQTALAQIAQDYKDGAAGALTDALKNYDADFGGRAVDTETAKAIEQARDFAKIHLAALDRFKQELAQVTQAGVKPSPNQLAGLLASLDHLEQEVSDLGTEDAQHAKASVAALRLHLNQKVAGDQDARATRLADILSRANQVVTQQLDAAQTADAAQAAVAAARKITAEADEITVNPNLRGPAEEATFQQLAALTAKLDELGTAANNVLASRAQFPQARSLDDYRGLLESLASNPLVHDPTVAAAHALAVKKPDWAGAAQHILLPNDPDTWAFLGRMNEARLEPADDNQKEDIDFSRLAHNGALANTYRADLVTYVNDAETARQPVFLAGPATAEENKIETVHEVIMDGKIIGSDGTAPEKVVRWAQFTGQKANGQKFENIKPAPESHLAALLTSAYDQDHSTLREPLLRVLDEVRADAESSPLLKAYYQQELFKIMQTRPRDWGLAFSPAARKDAAELAQITGGHLQATDWLFNPVNPHLPENLRNFYQQTGGVSYAKEALATMQNLLKLHATPVVFDGFVDLNNTPRLATAASEGAALWGFNATGNWSPLYHIRGGQMVAQPGPDSPARLTPLVYVQENVVP